MSFNKLVFDTTDAETIADSHHVGSHTLSGAGDLITSGDNDNDNLSTTLIEGLDVRGFNYIYDSVGDNWDRLQGVNGAVKVYIDDGDFEVDVVINAEKAEDSIHTTGDIGNFVLGIRIDDITADNSAQQAGTNGDYQAFFINDKGELYVKDADVLSQLVTIDAVLDSIKVDTGDLVVDLAAIEVELLDQGTTLDAINTNISDIEVILNALSHNEDDPHVSGDAGFQALSVRIDDINSPPVGSLAGAELDYQSLHTDAKGQLYVTISDPIEVNDAALANTAILHSQKPAAADDTAESALASALAGRKYLFLANEGNKMKAIGAAGVTIATGFPIHPGSYLELRAGAAVDVKFAARKAAGSDLRALELS